ncbi:putative NUDIX hydrolase [Tsuneonella dongtanensis]|uniref:Putative NUDIX hydrolase n=1 Tax=Tsuneonella dongtanensis TaxID=692370 RepID=A0A1B2ADI1_9SPHN|nr:CoA pyrophosphatase [Tsuneonella dongtanensis]ANY20105.1 putative NUDIX hydrolase [Tsuneonella dongtanensis]
MSALFDRLSRVLHAGHAREVELLTDAMAPPDLLRPAAVLIAVTERSDPGVLLTHRPETMRSHAGQAAFPGGKIDPGEDAVEAALREAHEELGIDPRDVRVIGPSDPFRTRTGYDVTPVLAVVPPDLPIRPNPAEVADWFEPPLAYVLDPANRMPRTVEWEGAQRTYFEIVWQGHRIWGVTAAIIGNLSRRLELAELFDG